MTLAATVRVPFSRAIANLRDDWDLAGVEAAMVELSQKHADPGECLALMVDWARHPDARTPAGVLIVVSPIEAVLDASRDEAHQPIGTPTPASLTVWCEPHGCNAKVRTDGTLTCCWQAQADERTDDFRRTGVTAPPADFRERVEAAKGTP